MIKYNGFCTGSFTCDSNEVRGTEGQVQIGGKHYVIEIRKTSNYERIRSL